MHRLVFVFIAFVWAATSGVAGTVPSKAPRLSDTSKFPREYQAAIHAVTAAIEKSGMKPAEYYAEISRDGSVLHCSLIYQNHDPDPHWRGDSCGKCRTVDFDMKSGVVGRILGIR